MQRSFSGEASLGATELICQALRAHRHLRKCYKPYMRDRPPRGITELTMGDVGASGAGGGEGGKGGGPSSTSISSATRQPWDPMSAATVPAGARWTAVPGREKPGGRSGEDWVCKGLCRLLMGCEACAGPTGDWPVEPGWACSVPEAHGACVVKAPPAACSEQPAHGRPHNHVTNDQGNSHSCLHAVVPGLRNSPEQLE